VSLTVEQTKELAQFPAPLRALVEAELAAGNAVLEVGHSFPAPPVGAYCKLANKVSTRPRGSGAGLDFYERNSSLYSGEFTDAKRFYFVIEAPDPPPPEPDMDAIRRARQGVPDGLARPAERPAGSRGELAGEKTSSSAAAEDQARGPDRPKLRRCLIATESATGAERVLHFCDKRPPHEVQFALERELMTLFTAAMDDGKLRLLAEGEVNGARHRFELRFEAALFRKNCYSLRVEVSWAGQPAAHRDYFRKTTDSWFGLWTRDLMAANPPGEGEGSADRYRRLSEAALQAEAQLDSVGAIQQAIVAGIKRGGSYSTAHKEGGTNIFWRDGVFVRSDYGDYPDHKQFADEAEFLKMLRQFCQWDVTRNAGKRQFSDFDTWKLILRLLRPR